MLSRVYIPGLTGREITMRAAAYATLSTREIDAALGPVLSDRIHRNSNLYQLVKLGSVAEVVGSLMAGADNRRIKKARSRVVARLETVLAARGEKSNG